MSTQTETQTPRERSWLYITSCIILAFMVLIALLTFRAARQNKNAQDKADQLIAALTAAGGASVPSFTFRASMIAAVISSCRAKMSPASRS